MAADDVAIPENIASRQELAAGLTVLRLRAGLTIRELAGRLQLPSATVGDYMSGRRLPGPAHLEDFRRLLAACGVEDDGATTAWLRALGRVRQATDGRLNHHVHGFHPDGARGTHGSGGFHPDGGLHPDGAHG